MISDMELAYHAEGWGPEGFVSALTETSRAGFAGIEMPSEVMKSFEDRLPVLQEMLEDAKLRLSGVEAVIESLNEQNRDEAAQALIRYAALAHAAGMGVLIVRPPPRLTRDVEAAEMKYLAQFLAEVGKECNAKDVRLAVRPDLDTIIERRSEVDALMGATPKAAVSLCVDTAHMLVVKVASLPYLKDHADRLAYVRIRDGRPKKIIPSQGWHKREPVWRPVGKGKLNLKQIIRALDKIDFEGWLCASQPPPVADPARACSDAFDALDDVLGSLG